MPIVSPSKFPQKSVIIKFLFPAQLNGVFFYLCIDLLIFDLEKMYCI